MCKELNCPGGSREACSHTVRRCLLCNRSDHFSGYTKCPSLMVTNPAPNTIPARPATPIWADDTSKTAISNTSRNRVRQQNKGRPGTLLAETMVDNGISSLRISELIDSDHADTALHKKGFTLPAPLKAKKSKDVTTGSRTVDDNKDCGFVLGVVLPSPVDAPPPKRTLMRASFYLALSSNVAV